MGPSRARAAGRRTAGWRCERDRRDGDDASHLRPRPEEDLPDRRRDRGAGAARRQRGRRAGRVRRRDRAVGLRQVDVHAHPGLPRSADVRRVRARRARRVAPVARRARRRAQPQDRVRLPGLQPAGAHERDRQRRAAAALQPRSRCKASERHKRVAGGARRRRPRRARAPPPQPAVGRAAAARGDRARAGHRARPSCWPTSRPATSTRGRASR